MKGITMKIIRILLISLSVSCFMGAAAWAATGFMPAAPSNSTQAGMPQSAQQPGTFQPGSPGAPNMGGSAPGTTTGPNSNGSNSTLGVPPVNNTNQQPRIAGGLNENTDITSPGIAPEPNPAPTITAGPHTGALGTPPGTFANNGSG